METMVEFFKTEYGWPQEQAEQKAAWMGQVQTGAALTRKQAIAADFQTWLNQR